MVRRSLSLALLFVIVACGSGQPGGPPSETAPEPAAALPTSEPSPAAPPSEDPPSGSPAAPSKVVHVFLSHDPSPSFTRQ